MARSSQSTCALSSSTLVHCSASQRSSPRAYEPWPRAITIGASSSASATPSASTTGTAPSLSLPSASAGSITSIASERAMAWRGWAWTTAPAPVASYAARCSAVSIEGSPREAPSAITVTRSPSPRRPSIAPVRVTSRPPSGRRTLMLPPWEETNPASQSIRPAARKPSSAPSAIALPRYRAQAEPAIDRPRGRRRQHLRRPLHRLLQRAQAGHDKLHALDAALQDALPALAQRPRHDDDRDALRSGDPRHAGDRLSVAGLPVQPALAGEDEGRPSHALAQSHDLRDDLDAGLDPRPQDGDEPRSQAAGRARPGHVQ